MARSRRAARRPRGRWLWPVALGLAVAALYASALTHPFVADDKAIVADNPTVSQPSAAGLAGLWTSDYWAGIDARGRVRRLSDDRNLYRPVTVLSLWLNSVLLGMKPAGFRIVNLALHVLAAWVIGLWCASWLGRRAGWLASGIFVLHPVATDVINRIVGRADVLALLGAAAFLAVQSAALREGWTARRGVAAAVAAAIAVGAKESGIVIVPLALAQAFLVRSESPRVRGGAGWLALGVPVALYGLARFAVVGIPRYEGLPGWELLQNPLAGKSVAARLPAMFDLATGYLRLSLAPWPLLTFDLPERVPAWSDPSVRLGLVLLPALLVAGVVLVARRRSEALGIVLWLASFAVVCQIVSPIGTYREVRLAYPMIAGMAFAAGVLATRPIPPRVPARVAALGLAALVGLAAVVAVSRRNLDFRDETAMLVADLRHRPDSPAARLRLGMAYRDLGRWTDAERLLESTTQAAPESTQAWHELGRLYDVRGDVARARADYRRALVFHPDDVGSLMRLGALEMRAGDLAAAHRYLDAASEHGSGRLLEYYLALLDAREGRRDEAIRRLKALLEAEPDLTRVAQVLHALETTGRVPE